MRRFIVLMILAVLALPAIGYAGIHGILKGKVTDADGPVIGATVMLEGTTIGNRTNAKGEFTIVNIVAGDYTVKVSFVGKEDYRVKVRITAEQTEFINVRLKDKGVTTKTVEVVAQKEKMVDNSAIGTKNVVKAEDLTNIAREGFAGVVDMAAGVTNEGDGFGFRGSRSSDSQVKFNGIDMSNQFTGGMGNAGTYYAPIISTIATEEVQILKGSFSAEHGEALGGIINTVPKLGRSETYDGIVRYRTDASALWGSQDKGVKVIKEGTSYKPIEAGPGLALQGKNEHLVEFSIGGPIPFLSKSTFNISSNYLYEQYRSNGYERYDPDGNNLGQMPDNGLWRKNITPVMSFQVLDNMKLVVGGMYGMTNWESSSWAWLYNEDEGTPYLLNGKVDPKGIPTPNGIPERVAKQNVGTQYLANVYARINHTLTNSSFYEFTVSSNISNELNARRKGWDDPNYFTGFDVYYPEDKYVFDGNSLVLAPKDPVTGRVASDKILDIYQPLTEIRYSADGYIRKDFNAINPLTGYYEGSPNATGTDNAFGQPYFRSHGAGGGVEFRENSYIQIDGNYTNVFKTGEFDHNSKAGFEVRLFEQARHYNGAPYDGNPWYDVYTNKWGGNIYIDDSETDFNAYDFTSKPVNPKKIAAYVQDQITYKGIVVSAGLRMDVFVPDSKYRTALALESVFIPINRVDEDSLFQDADIKYQLSPRINILYPITESSNISIAYGLFFKTPLLSNIYDNFYASSVRSGNILGNPNMDAEKSSQYEVSYRNQLTEDFAFTLTSYFKDTYNQLGTVYYAILPNPISLYDVTEYSNSRGIEVELRKAYSDNFAFNVNYVLAYSDGTSSGAFSNASVETDYFTEYPKFPLATYSLDNDIRHEVKANVTFYWGNNDGPSIGGIQLLENTNVSFTGGFSSGAPYTRLNLNQAPISEINSQRGPSQWSIDSRISKSFNLRDWFGESMKRSRIEVFADIRNLLNTTRPVSFYATTNDPLDDGITLNRQIGSFIATPYYKEASYANPASYVSDQYDSYGERLYNEKADFDKNGIVTQAERLQSYINYAELVLKSKGTFRAPLRIFMGVNISF